MTAWCRIPLYYELKLAFILWLVLPSTRGAEVLYKEVIWKLLHEYAAKFDPTFQSGNKVQRPSQIMNLCLLVIHLPRSRWYGFTG